MLNKRLYSCLIKLGADEDNAREAAKENKRIEEIHNWVYQVTRQSKSINVHLCEVDKRVCEIDKRLTPLEEKVDERLCRVESDVSTLTSDVRELKTPCFRIRTQGRSTG